MHDLHRPREHRLPPFVRQAGLAQPNPAKEDTTMASVWLTIVGEGAVLFGVGAGVTAWVRRRLVPATVAVKTPKA